MPQSCADACEDIKTHEDGEGFDAGVKTAEGFVKEGKADAEDCSCGQLCARPCVLDGMDEGVDRCVCANDVVISFWLKSKIKDAMRYDGFSARCLILLCA